MNMHFVNQAIDLRLGLLIQLATIQQNFTVIVRFVHCFFLLDLSY
jgi:hypothetical protein